jgi:hypothetical protein
VEIHGTAGGHAVTGGQSFKILTCPAVNARSRSKQGDAVTKPRDVTLCPFSRTICRECAIYRGRHLELCAFHNYKLRATKGTQTKAWTTELFTKWEMPEIPDGAHIMVDIEDFIEKEEIGDE